MQREYVQVKINIPKSEKSVAEYCDFLSRNRLLSATLIRLIRADMKAKNFK